MTLAPVNYGLNFCQTSTAKALDTDKDLDKLPKRRENSHKGTYGKMLVIAGSPTISGAAYFAAAAAYQMGSGLVKIYTPQENLLAMQKTRV